MLRCEPHHSAWLRGGGFTSNAVSLWGVQFSKHLLYAGVISAREVESFDRKIQVDGLSLGKEQLCKARGVYSQLLQGSAATALQLAALLPTS